MEFTRKVLQRLKALPLERCILCGTNATTALCRPCRDDLPRLRHACPRCAEPMPVANDLPCGRCQADPPAFATTYSPYLYQPPIDGMIRALKFEQRLDLAKLLGTLLGDYLRHALHQRPDLIVPVPMHPRRLGQRGFNQALELARFAARPLGLPVAATLARRTREAAPQVGLKRDQRQRNLRRAFAVEPLPDGCTVLVIDDVMTTGATTDALARTLRQKGAGEVIVATVARASRAASATG